MCYVVCTALWQDMCRCRGRACNVFVLTLAVLAQTWPAQDHISPASPMTAPASGSAGGPDRPDLTDLVFGTGYNTVHERFQDLTGNLLQAKLFELYATRRNAQLSFLDPEGKPALRRHALNNRSHNTVKEQYVANILAKGNVLGVRGAPWAVPSSDGSESHYDLLSFATLAESVYEAACREGQNPFVVETLKAGIPGATIFNIRTPKDVLSYLKQLHNEFHKGAGMNVLEVYDLVETVEASWNNFKTKTKLTSRGCPSSGPNTYERQYWRHIMEAFPSQLKNWAQWDSIKSSSTRWIQ